MSVESTLHFEQAQRSQTSSVDLALPGFNTLESSVIHGADRQAIELEKSRMDKIQTASIVVGTAACNARCRFCIASMTPEQGISRGKPAINWERFSDFMEYAQAGEAETVMLTGKGEPTLFPDHITEYLRTIKDNEERLGFSFTAKELQTNALLIAGRPETFEPLLKEWSASGLDTAAISIVHYKPEENRKEYTPRKDAYIDLPTTIRTIKEADIRVRLTCTLLDGYIDCSDEIRELISFAREHAVDELTVRPVNKPEQSRDDAVSRFVEQRFLPADKLRDIASYLNEQGTELQRLPHGAVVYDVDGQNVCLTNCLTPAQEGKLRQLISYPEGDITTDWQNARYLP
jgi:pyruvate-formate lyase-activating enzyme